MSSQKRPDKMIVDVAEGTIALKRHVGDVEAERLAMIRRSLDAAVSELVQMRSWPEKLQVNASESQIETAARRICEDPDHQRRASALGLLDHVRILLGMYDIRIESDFKLLQLGVAYGVGQRELNFDVKSD